MRVNRKLIYGALPQRDYPLLLLFICFSRFSSVVFVLFTGRGISHWVATHLFRRHIEPLGRGASQVRMPHLYCITHHAPWYHKICVNVFGGTNGVVSSAKISPTNFSTAGVKAKLTLRSALIELQKRLPWYNIPRKWSRFDIDRSARNIRPTCYPVVSGGESAIRRSLGKLLLVNLLQVVRRTSTTAASKTRDIPLLCLNSEEADSTTYQRHKNTAKLVFR